MSIFQTFSFVQNISAISLFFLFIIIELLLRRLKRKKAKEFRLKKHKLESIEEIEDLSIEHYRQNQHIDIIRFVIIFVGIVAILGAYNVQAFNVLAVATGAFILALRESFTSLVAFFYILSNYKSGDNIQIDKFLGEIVRVKPLYTDVAGKDEKGEYNGRLHHIPNFMFLNQIVDQQHLRSDDYIKVIIPIIYNKELFKDNFEIWSSKIEEYLSEILPKRTVAKIGNFKGYAGVKYKINLDYSEKGDVIVHLSFIVRSQKNVKSKELIIKFIESLRA